MWQAFFWITADGRSLWVPNLGKMRLTDLLQTELGDCAEMFVSIAQNSSMTGQAVTVGTSLLATYLALPIDAVPCLTNVLARFRHQRRKHVAPIRRKRFGPFVPQEVFTIPHSHCLPAVSSPSRRMLITNEPKQGLRQKGVESCSKSQHSLST